MKLELKHLAPYLPYQLKFSDTNDGHVFDILSMSDDSISLYSDSEPTRTIYLDNNNYPSIKPILRPMDDLGKQLPKTVVGRRYVDEINKESMYSLDKYGDFYDLPESMSVVDIMDNTDGLFKHHFDIFGLIDAGLAIDKNTI